MSIPAKIQPPKYYGFQGRSELHLEMRIRNRKKEEVVRKEKEMIYLKYEENMSH